MKRRVFCPLISLVLVVLCLCGCSAQTAKDSDASVASSIFVSEEMNTTDTSHQDNPAYRVPDRSTLTKTHDILFAKDDVDYYVDDASNIYQFDKETGSCVGYRVAYDTSEDETASHVSLNRQERIQVAKEFLADKIDVEQYSLVDESVSGFHSLTFSRMVGPYRTNESAIVMFNEYSEIYSYVLKNIGLLDGVDLPDIQQEEVHDEIGERVYDKFGEVEYEIASEVLMYENGRFYVDFWAIVNPNAEFSDELTGEIPIK